MFVATINVPGYLPTDTEPPEFETAREAWEYLREERARGEDNALMFARPLDETEPYSETWLELDKRADQGWPVCDFERVGTVYGDTPGYEGEHDLGLAYSVQEVC